jgi:methionyl-tRNA formyltransferase
MPNYLFAGNRFHVLSCMLEHGLSISKILAVKNSFLEQQLIDKNISYIPISSKSELLNQISNIEFDRFVSNGLPYIIPASILTTKGKQFINIHPSPLPQLRGADPVPGAILHRKDSGATCHFMNGEIDAGDIIEQIKVKYDSNWHAAFLYQLSFILEKQVFLKALKSNFAAKQQQHAGSNDVYYTFKSSDLLIDFNNDTTDNIISRVKAFNTPSKGAYFMHRDNKIKVWDAESYEASTYIVRQFRNKEIVFNTGSSIGIFHNGSILYLNIIEGKTGELKTGDII